MFRLSMHSCVLTRRHSLYENVQLEHAKTNAQPDRQAGRQPAATHPPTHPAIGCSTGDLGLRVVSSARNDSQSSTQAGLFQRCREAAVARASGELRDLRTWHADGVPKYSCVLGCIATETKKPAIMVERDGYGTSKRKYETTPSEDGLTCTCLIVVGHRTLGLTKKSRNPTCRS